MAQQKKTDRVLGPYPRRDKWRIVIIRGDGVRTYKDCPTQAQALSLKAALERHLAVAAGVTFGQAIEEYEQHLVAKGNKARAISTTILVLGRMFRHSDAPVSSLRTKEDGQRLYDDLRAATIPGTKPPRPYAIDTQRNTLAEAKTFLKWCVVRKYLRESPLADVAGFGKRRKGQDKPQLRLDEARRWTDTAVKMAADGSEGAVAALVAMLLALRSAEIVAICVRDLDDDGKLLWIPDSKTPAGRRQLEIPKVMRPLLRRVAYRKKPTDYVFGTGRRRDRNWVRKSVKRICRLAHVPEVDAHAMRRLHSTLATEAGATGHAVAQALGHESFRTTTDSYVKRGTTDTVRRRKALRVLEGGDRHGPRPSPDDTLSDRSDTPAHKSK